MWSDGKKCPAGSPARKVILSQPLIHSNVWHLKSLHRLEIDRRRTTHFFVSMYVWFLAQQLLGVHQDQLWYVLLHVVQIYCASIRSSVLWENACKHYQQKRISSQAFVKRSPSLISCYIMYIIHEVFICSGRSKIVKKNSPVFNLYTRYIFEGS